MSLVITQPVSTGTPFPLNNDAIYHVIDNNINSSMYNLYYQIRVHVTGQTSNTITLKLYEPDMVSPKGVDVNIKDYLKTQMDSVICNEITDPMPYEEWLLVTLNIKSFYYNSPTSTTPIEYSSASCVNRCWNGVVPFNDAKEGLQNVYNKFLAQTVPPFVNASDAPRPLGYKSLIPYIISINLDTFPSLTQIRKYAYKTSLNSYRTATWPMWGGVLDTQYWEFYNVVTFTKNFTPNKLFIYKLAGYSMEDATRFGNFPVGVQNINAVNWNSYNVWNGSWTPSRSFDISNTDYYYMCFPINVSYQFMAQPLFFEIRHCTQLRHKELALLYKTFDGGWNQIDVHGNFQRDVNIETKLMNNTYPTSPSKWLREKNIVNVYPQGKWTLNTEWLDQARVDECVEMFHSPIIYLCDFTDSTPVYTPVTVTSTEINDYYVPKDKLVQYTIKLEEAFNDNVIRK